ncbi:ferritin [Rudanella paleaurantiibacter]|uniref:Ferritin n=1 Tax=Rudanella paleaurantiibacter TaxID=2614655 RepID=A0A7J5TWE2_9BACT|nr:ferritin [Rudanella paleaurantiibacter]KAB7728757.1 ferritin [Rudanella paleaurantiibacter]
MKNLLRLHTSLKEEIEIALNAQVKMEAEASHKYQAMASWLEQNGYEHSANYLYRQADEERAHSLKIFRYINEMGGSAITPAVGEVTLDFTSFRSVFEAALQSEIAVTHAINRIVGKCRQVDDYATESFMMWFVNEQREEERNARRALELCDLIEETGTGKYTLDKEIAKISAEEE